MDVHRIIGETTRSMNLPPTKSAIYVWGYNQNGQTGRNGKERQLRIPKQLPPELFGCPAGANARWLDIACGREHTAAVASDGSLFTWGLLPFTYICIAYSIIMYPQLLRITYFFMLSSYSVVIGFLHSCIHMELIMLIITHVMVFRL